MRKKGRRRNVSGFFYEITDIEIPIKKNSKSQNSKKLVLIMQQFPSLEFGISKFGI